METIRIKNGTTEMVSENFSMQEVWNSMNPKHEYWDCPKSIIDGLQIIRDWAGVPVVCSSTYRNPDPYGRYSSHEEGKAFDTYSKVKDIVTAYNTELQNYIDGKGSELIDKLRSAGITGLGIEKHCIHLEIGDYGERKRIGKYYKGHTDKYGVFTCFIWTGFGPNDINKAI